jgi:hypothetical protein
MTRKEARYWDGEFTNAELDALADAGLWLLQQPPEPPEVVDQSDRSRMTEGFSEALKGGFWGQSAGATRSKQYHNHDHKRRLWFAQSGRFRFFG